MSDTAQSRQVSFMESLSLFFKNYANFQGRSSRGAYWWYIVWSIIFTIAAAIPDALLFSDMTAATGGTGPFGAVLGLALLIPGIALGVRRLHDIGKSGWWTLIVFTIIGILLIIYWACQPGQRTANRFGPDVEAGR